MKKLFTLVVVVLMVVGAKAQTEIVVGPKVGLNMTNISNSDRKNKLSFHVGGFAEFRFNDYFAIQPEFKFSTRASREERWSSIWREMQGTSSSPASLAARSRRSPATSSQPSARRRTVRGWTCTDTHI